MDDVGAERPVKPGERNDRSEIPRPPHRTRVERESLRGGSLGEGALTGCGEVRVIPEDASDMLLLFRSWKTVTATAADYFERRLLNRAAK